jgi:hypothetical protein
MVGLAENPPPPHRPVGTCTTRLCPSILVPSILCFCPGHLKTCSDLRKMRPSPDVPSTRWVPSGNCRTSLTSLTPFANVACRTAVSAPASMWGPLQPSVSPCHVTVLLLEGELPLSRCKSGATIKSQQTPSKQALVRWYLPTVVFNFFYTVTIKHADAHRKHATLAIAIQVTSQTSRVGGGSRDSLPLPVQNQNAHRLHLL